MKQNGEISVVECEKDTDVLAVSKSILSTSNVGMCQLSSDFRAILTVAIGANGCATPENYKEKFNSAMASSYGGLWCGDIILGAIMPKDPPYDVIVSGMFLSEANELRDSVLRAFTENRVSPPEEFPYDEEEK